MVGDLPDMLPRPGRTDAIIYSFFSTTLGLLEKSFGSLHIGTDFQIELCGHPVTRAWDFDPRALLMT